MLYEDVDGSFFSIEISRLFLRIIAAGSHSEHGDLDLNMSITLSALPKRRINEEKQKNTLQKTYVDVQVLVTW